MIHPEGRDPLGRAGPNDRHFVADLQKAGLLQRDGCRADRHVGVGDPKCGLLGGRIRFGRRAVVIIPGCTAGAADVDEGAFIFSGRHQDGAIVALPLTAKNDTATLDEERAGDAIFPLLEQNRATNPPRVPRELRDVIDGRLNPRAVVAGSLRRHLHPHGYVRRQRHTAAAIAAVGEIGDTLPRSSVAYSSFRSGPMETQGTAAATAEALSNKTIAASTGGIKIHCAMRGNDQFGILEPHYHAPKHPFRDQSSASIAFR